jgi:type IX secretion system PorP/SprF family membrane protein
MPNLNFSGRVLKNHLCFVFVQFKVEQFIGKFGDQLYLHTIPGLLFLLIRIRITTYASEVASMKSTIWISCIITFFQLFAHHISNAQRLPFFNHYFDNPYLYNPAYAGYDKHAVFYLTHRQQWLGVEGAPVSSQLSFHTPLGNANPLFIGGDIMNDQLGALSHTAVKFTSAYLIPLSAENEHYIKTAFSAGLGMHSYDFGSMDIGDDAVLQAAQANNMYLDGRFGIRYHNQGFNLSIALPHLFSPPSVINQGFTEPGIDELSRMIFSTHYRFDFSPEGGLSFEPTVLYHYNREGASQVEGMGVFYYRSREAGKNQQDLFWVGGSYQQQSGIGGLAGVRVKNLKFSYAFSTGGSAVSAYGMGSHEIQLGFVIGKKKAMLKRKPRLRTGDFNEEVPDEALMKKHARSREKSKKEELPDRKRVQPTEQAVAPSEKAPYENQATTPGEVLEATDLKTTEEENQIAPGSNRSTKETTVETTPISGDRINPDGRENTGMPEKPVPSEKRDYSNMKFESFESNDGGLIELGQPSEPQNSANTQEISQKPTDAAGNKPGEASQPVVAEQKPTPSENQQAAAGPDGNAPVMQTGYYIVAGTFSAEANALKLAARLTDEGFEAAVGYHAEKQYYYVHAKAATTLDEARAALEQLKQNPALTNAWILRVKPE